MFFSLISELITLFALSLPFCLIPKLIVGLLNDGISSKPLDEFPIIKSTWFKIEKYFCCPNDLKK